MSCFINTLTSTMPSFSAARMRIGSAMMIPF